MLYIRRRRESSPEKERREKKRERQVPFFCSEQRQILISTLAREVGSFLKLETERQVPFFKSRQRGRFFFSTQTERQILIFTQGREASSHY